MKLSDFYKGQTVYVKESVYRKKEPIIHQVQVCSVGRKYVTVQFNSWKRVRFDATNNFREDTEYTPNLSIYLSKEEIERETERREKERKVENAFLWQYRMVYKLSDEDLDSILKICEKYMEANHDK